jgi:hypothetical protein
MHLACAVASICNAILFRNLGIHQLKSKIRILGLLWELLSLCKQVWTHYKAIQVLGARQNFGGAGAERSRSWSGAERATLQNQPRSCS